MSAYFVETATVTAIVAAGLGRTEPSLIGNAASNPLRWHDGEKWHELRTENATEIGRMLLAENIASLAHRYRLDNENGDELIAYELETAGYDYPDGGWIYSLTASDVCGAISNYQYQSCEHPDWRESASYALTQSLKERMLSHLCPNSGWGITAEQLAAKRSSARSLMGMIGR